MRYVWFWFALHLPAAQLIINVKFCNIQSDPQKTKQNNRIDKKEEAEHVWNKIFVERVRKHSTFYGASQHHWKIFQSCIQMNLWSSSPSTGIYLPVRWKDKKIRVTWGGATSTSSRTRGLLGSYATAAALITYMNIRNSSHSCFCFFF